MSSWRYLTAAEIALLPHDFANSFPIEQTRLINRTHNPFAIGKILTRPKRIYWKNAPRDFTGTSLAIQALYVHELCHIWQYHTGRLTAWRYLTRRENWKYHYQFEPGKPFDAYPIEEQADLLQDWYLVNSESPVRFYDTDSAVPNAEDINAVVPFSWKPHKLQLRLNPEASDFIA